MRFKVCLIAVSLLCAFSAGASSVYDHLENETGALSSIAHRALLKTLVLGLDRLTADERASLDIKPRGERELDVSPQNVKASYFHIVEPVPGRPFDPAVDEEGTRKDVLRGLILGALYGQHSSVWREDNARWIHSLLLESAKNSPERLQILSYALTSDFLREALAGRPYALPLYYFVVAHTDADLGFWDMQRPDWGGHEKVAGVQQLLQTSNWIVPENLIYDVFVTALAGALKEAVPGLHHDSDAELDASVRAPKFNQLGAVINRLYQSRVFAGASAGKNDRGRLSAKLGVPMRKYLEFASKLSGVPLQSRAARTQQVKNLSVLGFTISKTIRESAYFQKEILRTSAAGSVDLLALECGEALKRK